LRRAFSILFRQKNTIFDFQIFSLTLKSYGCNQRTHNLGYQAGNSYLGTRDSGSGIISVVAGSGQGRLMLPRIPTKLRLVLEFAWKRSSRLAGSFLAALDSYNLSSWSSSLGFLTHVRDLAWPFGNKETGKNRRCVP